MALKQCEAPFPDDSSQAGSYEAHTAAPQAAEATPSGASTTLCAEDDSRQYAEAPGTPTESNPSAAQLAANRSNARYSTGPRTPQGKARVAQNAIRHGLYSRDSWKAAPHLGEDLAEYEALQQELMEDFDPQDRSEHDLVQRIAGLIWRLARVHRAMEEMLTYRCSLTEEEAARGVKADTLFDGLLKSAALSPLETHLSRELSRLQRDLAFSQRYRHVRADKQAAQDRKTGHAEPELTEAGLIALLDAQAAGYAAAMHAEDPEEPEYDEEADAIGEEAYQALLASKKRRSHQALSAKSREQTQFGDAQEAPGPSHGSNDLT